MPVDNLFRETFQYHVSTDVFTGPLDLLLILIEREELDITKLSLSKVTNQYLAYLNSLSSYSAEEVSGFLVMAARLIQIKSEALLPRAVIQNEGKEDTGDALIQQLIRYRQFKKLAETLEHRRQQQLRTYLRINYSNSPDAPIDLNLTVADLTVAAYEAFRQDEININGPENSISPPKITIRQKIRLIANFLRDQERISFRQLLSSSFSRLDVAISFLAVLELVKQHMVEVFQPRLFKDIEIRTSDLWKEEVEFELEFGE